MPDDGKCTNCIHYSDYSHYCDYSKMTVASDWPCKCGGYSFSNRHQEALIRMITQEEIDKRIEYEKQLEKERWIRENQDKLKVRRETNEKIRQRSLEPYRDWLYYHGYRK